MRVPMRVPHIAAFINEHVIEQCAVAVLRPAELLGEISQILHMIPVHPGVVRDILRLVAVVRGAVPPAQCKSDMRA